MAATTMGAQTLAGNEISFYWTAQAAQDAINATPVFKPYHLRTGGFAVTTVNTAESAAITTDRQPVGSFTIGETYAADLEGELSYEQVPLIQAAMHSTPALSTVSSSAIAITASGFDGSGADFNSIVAGDFIYLTGATNPPNNRWYRVTSNIADTLVTSPAPAATEVAGTALVFTSNRTDAASDYYLITGQTRVRDDSLADDTAYSTYVNGFLNSFALTVPEEGINTTTFNVMFEQEWPSTAKIVGQTDAAVSTAEAATTPLITVWVNGVKSEQCELVSTGLTFGNNYEEGKAAQCRGSKMAIGDITLTGDLVMRAYVDETTRFRNIYKNNQVVSIAYGLDFKDGKSMIVVLPAIKITEHSFDGETIANNTMTYTAQRDAAAGTCLQIFTNF